MALLEVEDLRVRFHSTGKEVVHGIDFAIAEGERFGLVGESGSGKTVTAMAISGLIERSQVTIGGSARFAGRDLLRCDRRALRRVQGKEIGVVFQEPMTSLNPLLRVGPQIEETLLLHTDKSAEERRSMALSAMEMVGLPQPELTYRKYPHQLSGGQRQRAMIASAMIIHPRLLICDEPTTALDVRVQAQILALLRSLSEEYGVAILLISHELRVVRNLCERVAVMQRGLIVEQGETEEVFTAPKEEYTRKLIAALPKRTPKGGAEEEREESADSGRAAAEPERAESEGSGCAGPEEPERAETGDSGRIGTTENPKPAEASDDPKSAEEKK